MTDADVVVVGAGIVGLASAVELQRRHRGATVVVIDKEPGPARHQTGHNSGVVHSGIYYAPGSEKARLVAAARDRLQSLCREHGVPLERCGKVVVATRHEELPGLRTLELRAAAHGIEVRRLRPHELRRIEPHVRGVAALHVPSAGITDFGRVAEALAQELAAAGGTLRTGVELRGVEHAGHGRLRLLTSTGTVTCRALVNCAGLHSDRVARLAGADPKVSIVPFRGEYRDLRPEARHLVRNLVYPVPDLRWPFLGVHLTRTVQGGVHAGPNALLAGGREAYDGGVVGEDLLQMLGDRGLWRLALRYWRTGAAELVRARSPRRFLGGVRQLVPEVGEQDLLPGGCGIRAQAVTRDGRLLDDFAFATSPGAVHVLNAPSPAATAALAIAEVVADRAPLAAG